jgi:hypothetical protein
MMILGATASTLAGVNMLSRFESLRQTVTKTLDATLRNRQISGQMDPFKNIPENIMAKPEIASLLERVMGQQQDYAARCAEATSSKPKGEMTPLLDVVDRSLPASDGIRGRADSRIHE